jgi:hypothetical protein
MDGEMAEDVLAICTWLRVNVYTPLINGEAMPVGKVARQGSFYDRLCKAEIPREAEEGDEGCDNSIVDEDVEMTES